MCLCAIDLKTTKRKEGVFKSDFKMTNGKIKDATEDRSVVTEQVRSPLVVKHE